MKKKRSFVCTKTRARNARENERDDNDSRRKKERKEVQDCLHHSRRPSSVPLLSIMRQSCSPPYSTFNPPSGQLCTAEIVSGGCTPRLCVLPIPEYYSFSVQICCFDSLASMHAFLLFSGGSLNLFMALGGFIIRPFQAIASASRCLSLSNGHTGTITL